MRNAARSYQRFTRDEDRVIARRRMRGLTFRAVAKELGRTTDSVRCRYYMLERWLEEKHGDILEKHREEELALLEKLLVEAKLPDCGELQ